MEMKVTETRLQSTQDDNRHALDTSSGQYKVTAKQWRMDRTQDCVWISQVEQSTLGM